MTEAEIRTRMKNAFGRMNVHSTPIEVYIGKGIPDVNWCVNGKEFWTELKVITATNRLREQLKPEQVAWLLKRTNAGGNAWVVGQHIKTHWYYAWWGGDARELSKAEDHACLLAHSAHSKLETLLKVLTTGKPT